ncbi:MAG: hypothetical protein WD875_11865 [Pirellulales bacterium]
MGNRFPQLLVARDMVGKKKDEKKANALAAYVEIVRIQETERTKRSAILGVVFLGGLAMICWAVVKLSESPPWLQALAILVGTGGPAVWMWRMRVRFRSYMARDHERLRQLEIEADGKRGSSGMNADGTTPDGT